MRLVYTREIKYIGTKWSRVTCLTLPLDAAQSLGSQSLRCLMVAIENKQHKQINKQYTKQCLKTKQIVSKYSAHHYKHVSVRIT
jgi:hypothetical protein